MRLWSFGSVHAERAHFGSAFARATADAAPSPRAVKGTDTAHAREGGVTWEFSDQELIFLGVAHTSKGMKSASMRWQAVNPAPSVLRPRRSGERSLLLQGMGPLVARRANSLRIFSNITRRIQVWERRT
jgi:hypothetical protein